MPGQAFDAALVMHHNFEMDREALYALAAGELPFVGLLGPVRRREDLFRVLPRDGARSPAAAPAFADRIEAGRAGTRSDRVEHRRAVAGLPIPAMNRPSSSARRHRARRRRQPPSRSPKQLLMREGETLVHRAVRLAAATQPQRLLLVVGAHADEVREAVADLRVDILINDEWQEGLASSLRVAVGALGEDDASRIDPGLRPAGARTNPSAAIAGGRSRFVLGLRGDAACFGARRSRGRECGRAWRGARSAGRSRPA